MHKTVKTKDKKKQKKLSNCKGRTKKNNHEKQGTFGNSKFGISAEGKTTKWRPDKLAWNLRNKKNKKKFKNIENLLKNRQFFSIYSKKYPARKKKGGGGKGIEKSETSRGKVPAGLVNLCQLSWKSKFKTIPLNNLKNPEGVEKYIKKKKKKWRQKSTIGWTTADSQAGFFFFRINDSKKTKAKTFVLFSFCRIYSIYF